MKKGNSILKSALVLTSAAFFSVIFLSSCLKNNDNVEPDPVAGLMAFNLAPDQPAIGIKLSGNNLTSTPLSYINYTGGYLPIYPGSRSIAAFDADSGESFTSSDFTFDENSYYSLFVAGTENGYQNIVVKDPLDSLPVVSGKAYIRYINAVVDGGETEVTISNGGGNLVNQNATFATVSDFVEAEAGDVTIAINNSDNVQADRTITLEDRKVYTILLTGIAGSDDAATKVQIKYIENGTLTEEATTQQGISLRSPNSILMQ